jgi:acyl-CoA synthetase (NDP forming)
MEIITHPDDAEFVVQRTAPPGVPVAVGGLEDALFGPAVSFSVSGALTDLVGDRAYRIPPISALDAAETVRSIKAAPLLFGYRGSEQVDVPAVEELVRRVAQLKIDLPQVCRIDLQLVHATAHGAEVLHAVGRVEPMSEPRSDLFVRRLTAPLDDTLPG